MEIKNVAELISHSRNNEFFDDITGDNWKEFLESVKTSGVIEPIVITQDKIIVSGHQRVKASKELGIKDILCRIKIYESNEKWSKDDLIIKELLETNLRQRGIGNLNPIKFAKCIVELERLYGIKNGGDRGNQYKEADKNNSPLATQKQLAEQFSIDESQLRNYKKLLTLIPELQELVETNKLSATTAYKVYAKLSSEEQQKLLNDLGVEKISKMTKIQAEEEIEKLVQVNEELQKKEREWYEKYQIEKNKKQQVKEVEKPVEKIIEKEVIPNNVKEKLKKLNEVEKEVEQLRPLRERFKKEEHFLGFHTSVKIFLDATASIVYKKNELKDLPDDEKQKFVEQIGILEGWINNFKLLFN